MDAAFGKGNAIMKIDDPATGAFSFDVSAMKGSSIMPRNERDRGPPWRPQRREQPHRAWRIGQDVLRQRLLLTARRSFEINGKTITITEDMTAGRYGSGKVNASAQA